MAAAKVKRMVETDYREFSSGAEVGDFLEVELAGGSELVPEAARAVCLTELPSEDGVRVMVVVLDGSDNIVFSTVLG